MAIRVQEPVRPLAELEYKTTTVPVCTRFWPDRWWNLMNVRIGVIPLPVYLLLVGMIVGLVCINKITTDISVIMAVTVVGGFTLGEIGKHIPVLKSIGGGVICATFIPSAMAYYHLVPAALAEPVTQSFKSTNILYLFITAIIVGSILSMDRKVLIQGFFKIFVPMAAGTIVAAVVGTLVGMAFGMDMRDTFFFTVVPIMCGGVGEGAIPLSIGYGQILHQSQGDMFARVLPPVMLGSLTAILLAGLLNYIGKRLPHLTGEGRLQPGGQDETEINNLSQEEKGLMDVSNVAAAGTMMISLYLVGLLGQQLFRLPAPVGMLFAAVAVKLSRAVSPALQRGSSVVYSFFHKAVVYPILFAVGVAITPWDKLVAAFRPANLITIAATVVSLVVTGFIVARWVKLYPVEAAIINATRGGQGGTGDVAILTASNRMVLMPFAQVATRIGGAITVTLALILLGSIQ